MAYITQEEFGEQLATFSRSAWRWEAQPSYALGYEREVFDRFLAGSPVTPDQVDWWRQWLEQISAMTREGKTISRVRVLHDPPTDYQRMQLWGNRWHADAGEDIRYIRHADALRAGLPLDHDWWLLDDSALLLMRYNGTGVPSTKELVTEAEVVATYREWRDLAVRNAMTAEHAAA